MTVAAPRDIPPGLFKPAVDVRRMTCTASHPAPTNPVIGQGMPDSTVYAGISPDTGKPMYTTPADSGLCGCWYDATARAGRLDAHGHTDWRVPSVNELNVLLNNRADIGGFDTSGSDPAGWYWSSSEYGRYYGHNACKQRFSDGLLIRNSKCRPASLRCVRG